MTLHLYIINVYKLTWHVTNQKCKHVMYVNIAVFLHLSVIAFRVNHEKLIKQMM